MVKHPFSLRDEALAKCAAPWFENSGVPPQKRSAQDSLAAARVSAPRIGPPARLSEARHQRDACNHQRRAKQAHRTRLVLREADQPEMVDRDGRRDASGDRQPGEQPGAQPLRKEQRGGDVGGAAEAAGPRPPGRLRRPPNIRQPGAGYQEGGQEHACGDQADQHGHQPRTAERAHKLCVAARLHGIQSAREGHENPGERAQECGPGSGTGVRSRLVMEAAATAMEPATGKAAAMEPAAAEPAIAVAKAPVAETVSEPEEPRIEPVRVAVEERVI